MTELRPCRYCKGKAKRYTREGRNYIGEECFVSTCYCMMCGMQVEAFDESVKAKDLYNVYTKWCDDNGEYKLTNTKFGQEIQKRFERKRNNSGYFYSGIVFSNDYEMYKISIKE